MVTPGRPSPLFTVIVPTHNHAFTLDLAVKSVLSQSIDAVDVVIVGDGVGDETRDVVSSLVSDRRVRFLDRPKSPSRAELVRHEVLTAASSPYVSYMGDDDLMLPDHLESTMERLQAVDFTQPLPAFIKRDGSMGFYLTDISDPRCTAWHLVAGQNAISLTGAGHRLDAYLKLPHGWRQPPPGTWSDHYMWQQWFSEPSMRFSTGDRLTVLKFDAHARQDMTGSERRDELTSWLDRSKRPDFAGALNASAGVALRRKAVQTFFELAETRHQVVDALNSAQLLRAELEAVAQQSQAHEASASAFAAEARAYALSAQEAQRLAAELEVSLHATRSTRTWRLHDRLARWSFLRWLANR